ncbi:hypothetical protein FGRMN_7255 [Fusarium graminum]|nr:hypothetical protein FGRMN_7255 [Fusarium graminum]
MRIPPELYLEISKLCDKSTLDSLSRVSKAWRNIFAPRLFARVRFGDTQLRIDNMLRTLCHGRHKARMDVTRTSTQEGLPARLVDALSIMKDEQVEEFTTSMNAQGAEWPQLHSLRIKAPSKVIQRVISHCDPKVLVSLHLYNWYLSNGFEWCFPKNPAKEIRVRNLERLRLSYDESNTDHHPRWWPAADKDMWIRLYSIFQQTSRKLKWLVLHGLEKAFHLLDRENSEYLESALVNIENGLKSLKGLEHFAISFHYESFSPWNIRRNLGQGQNGTLFLEPLTTQEADAWYEMITRRFMDGTTLEEVYVLCIKSKLYKGTRLSDGTVTFEIKKRNGFSPLNYFPWGFQD